MPFLRGVVSPEAIQIRDAVRGRRLARIPLGEAALKRYGTPYCLVHRADLQAALLAAARGDNRIAIELGVTVETVAECPGGLQIVAGGVRSAVHLLVGADGIHSRLRTGHFGHPGPRSLGRQAWRATLAAHLIPDGTDRGVTGLWLAPGAHLVHYPLRGGEQLNLVVISGASTLPSPPAELFGVSARKLIDTVPAWTPWPLHDVDVAPAWSRGRCVLVGDAAHAMAPSAAQGGAQAIEDAWILAQSLAADPGAPARALASYERTRRPRVERIVREARRNLGLYNLRGVARLFRNATIAALPPKGHLARLDWLFGWTPGQKP
jgi:salicylate hydroxylase